MCRQDIDFRLTFCRFSTPNAVVALEPQQQPQLNAKMSQIWTREDDEMVKLMNGEYISPGKIESVLKCCHVVENMCVVARSGAKYCVALVLPNVSALQITTKTASGSRLLISEEEIRDKVWRELVYYGIKSGLGKYEIPKRIALISDAWTVDTGLVTATLKTKRREVCDFYSQTIDKLYADQDSV